MDIFKAISGFIPSVTDEHRVIALMQRQLDRHGLLSLQRHCPTGHFTVSAMVFSADLTHVLFAFHNIYRSWAWLGGHADGQTDLFAVAAKELFEESGLLGVSALSALPISAEILPVAAHRRKGQPVDAHLHFNLTYAFICPGVTFAPRRTTAKKPCRRRFAPAKVRLALCCRPGENCAAGWIPISRLGRLVTEKHMLPIYNKIIRRVLDTQVP
ncbi:MAG: hypothetical protein IJP03_06170 [Christensenellaceae bacterium]|nr:hypothetical protein [Christensenellaceae bacterium]